MKSFPASVLLVVALCVTALSLGYIVFNASPSSPLALVPIEQRLQLAQVAPSSGLIQHWKFDEGSGNTVSAFVGGRSDTLGSPAWTTGKIGGALSFNGSDYVNLGNITTSKITISAWIKPESNTGFGSIAMKQNVYGLETQGDQVYARIGNGSDWTSNLSAPITYGVWQLVTMTFDSTKSPMHTLYVHDESGSLTQRTSNTATLKTSSGSPFLVGAWDLDFSEPFKGVIDDVRIYNRALSTSEVASLIPGGSSTGADTTAPNISSVTATDIEETAATIKWTTNEAADTEVDFGLTSSYGNHSTLTDLGTNMINGVHTQTLVGLTKATVYNYRVKSRDAAGNLAVSGNYTFTTTGSTADTTKPSTPAKPRSSVVTQTSMTLSWSPATDNVRVVGYSIYRDGVLITPTLVSGTTFLVTGLIANTTYSFQVAAHDAAGNVSNQSTALSVKTAPVPSLPPVVTLTVNGSIQPVTITSGQSVTFTWTTANNPTSCVGSGTNFSSSKSITGGTLLVTLTTVGTGKYSVICTNSGGTVSSPEVSVVVNPVVSTGPVLSNITAGDIISSEAAIRWTTDVKSDTQVEFGVVVPGATPTYTGKSALKDLGSSMVTSHQQYIAGLRTGTAYNYRVLSRDAQGRLSTSPNYTFTTTGGTTDVDVLAPSAPTALVATPVSSSQINLAWTASTDNVGVLGYQVMRSSAGSAEVQIANITPAAITFQNTSGLSPNTTYTYRVRAYDAAGNVSGYSVTVSATTQSGPVTTGSILTKLVGSNFDVATAPVGVVSKVDTGATTAINPVLSLNVQPANHTVAATDATGYTETYGVCTYDQGAAECSMPTDTSYRTTGLTCAAGYCSVVVPVTAGQVSKVVFKYNAASAPSYSLSTNTGGTGGSISRSPSGTSFTAGTVVNLTGTPTTGGHTATWSVSPAAAISSGCSAGINTCSIVMNANTTVTATFSAPVVGSVYYVKQGGAGSMNGTDWNNAYSSLPASLVSGATYYIAPGSYGALSVSTSNVTIRRALADQPFTTVAPNTVVSTSDDVVFSSANITGNNVTIDGNGWHGIQFTVTGTVSMPSGGDASVKLAGRDIMLKNAFFNGSYSGPYAMLGIVPPSTGTTTISYSDFYQSSKEDQWNIAATASGGNVVFDHNVFRDNNKPNRTDTSHRDVANPWTGSGGWGLTVSNNIFFNTDNHADDQPQGDEILLQIGYSGSATPLKLVHAYNNVVYNTARFIAFGSSNSGVNDFKVYNNTIRKVINGSDIGITSTSPAPSPTAANNIGNSTSNTGFINGSPINIDAVYGSDGKPFTSDDAFALTSGSSGAINSGNSSGLKTSVDITGASRIGTVDLGAYEYGGTVAPPPGDTTDPTVSLTAPAAGSTVTGSVTLSASASDNVGVAGVQFKVDGVNVGSEDTTSSYSTTWNTTATTNGAHTITAVARDAVGNTTTSASRTVTVSNSAPRSTKFPNTTGYQVEVDTPGTFLNVRSSRIVSTTNVLGTALDGIVGTIVTNTSNGIFENGYYWWYVTINGVTGWAAQDYLITYTASGASYSLSTNVVGGTISRSPSGTTYAAGTTVTLTASAAATWSVTSGTPASTITSGTCAANSTICTVTINSNTSVTATIASTATGAAYYVTKTGAGSKNGTSWANAWADTTGIPWSSIPIATGGTTIYLSGGPDGGSVSYSSFTTGKGGTSNTNRLTLKRSTEPGHNGTVKLTSTIQINHPYFTLDGVDRNKFHIWVGGGGSGAQGSINTSPASDYFEIKNTTIEGNFSGPWGHSLGIASPHALVSGNRFIKSAYEDMMNFIGRGSLTVEYNIFEDNINNDTVHRDIMNDAYGGGYDLNIVGNTVTNAKDVFLIQNSTKLGDVVVKDNTFTNTAWAFRFGSGSVGADTFTSSNNTFINSQGISSERMP